MSRWLLESGTRDAMRAGGQPTATQQIEYEAAARESQSRILTVAGTTAEIAVHGVLTQAPDFMARFFGGGNTTYAEIRSALAEAEADPNVRSITLDVNSGGGQIAGLFDTLAAIEAVRKPVNALIRDLGASAAYAIAAQADSIKAANAATRVGSIGVATSMALDSQVVDITSTEAPNKRPDVSTEEGKAVVQAELDDLHAVFVDSIAKGRSTSTSKINAEFGRGGILLANKALEKGMIDGISGSIPGNSKSEAKTKMDIETLKAQHPEVYTAAVNCGVDQERDRVKAHITWAEKSGAHKTAFTAIQEGSRVTDSILAEYQTAALDKRDIEGRQDDAENVDAALGGATTPKETEKDAGDTLFEAFDAKRNSVTVL